MRRRPSAHRRTVGFTLIELLIVVAVVALLAAIAWPAFMDSVFRSRRADAMAALSAIQQAQERWRANNPTYQTTLADLTGASASVSHDQHYDLSFQNSGLDSKVAYAARATVRSSSPQSRDSRCHWLQVNVNSGTITYTSGIASTTPPAGEGGGQSSDGDVNAAPDPCWVR